MAPIAYVEQVGWNRQLTGSNGDTATLYRRTGKVNNDAGKPVSALRRIA
jgi:hypothetical protein